MRTDRFISKRPLGRLTSALKCRRKSYFPSHEILVLVFQDYVLETLAVLKPRSRHHVYDYSLLMGAEGSGDGLP